MDYIGVICEVVGFCMKKKFSDLLKEKSGLKDRLFLLFYWMIIIEVFLLGFLI